MEQQYSEYCKQVCAVLKKATKKEKASLSEELLDHMESHAEALIELGWDPEEAHTYAIQAMGDAEVVGRQYDEKLSSFWLWCGRVLRVVLIVSFILLLSGPVGTRIHQIRNNLQARWHPEKEYGSDSVDSGLLFQLPMKRVIQQGAQCIQIYRVETYYNSAKERYEAEIYTVSYAKNPWEYTMMKDPYLERWGHSGYGTAGAVYRNYKILVEEGQEFVVLTIPIPGEDTQVQIPIPWEVSNE